MRHLLLVFILGVIQTARAEPLSPTHLDHQVHFLGTTQLTLAADRGLQKIGIPRMYSVLGASALVLGAATAKEVFRDQTFSEGDEWANVLGVSTGALISFFAPHIPVISWGGLSTHNGKHPMGTLTTEMRFHPYLIPRLGIGSSGLSTQLSRLGAWAGILAELHDGHWYVARVGADVMHAKIDPWGKTYVPRAVANIKFPVLFTGAWLGLEGSGMVFNSHRLIGASAQLGYEF